MLVGGWVSTFYGSDTILIVFAVLAFLTLFIVRRLKGSSKITIETVKRRTAFNAELISLIVMGFVLTLIFQGFLKSTMSYWVGNQNFTSIPFLQVLGAATITGLLITVKLSLDPIVAPWIGKLNDRSTTGNRFVVLLTIVASTLLILFPLKMNIVIWLSLTILLLLLSTTLMNLNDAKIFLYATGQHRHSVISTYSMTSDLGAAVGPLLGFSFISFLEI